MNTSPTALHLAIQAECHADLYFYSRYMFKERKKYRWLDNWHHRLICDKLMAVFRGEIKRLIINIPPRYSKTELTVTNFMSWCLGLVADCEFIYLTYSAKLAGNYSYQTRMMLEHESYQAIFDTRLKTDSKAKDHWQTTAGGTVYSAGAGGTITGFGAGKMRSSFGGAIIIDDPHKADEARSDVMRQNVIDWFTNTVESRTNSPDTPIIIIMQRLHEDDLSGFLLNGGNGEHWEHLCLPAINEQGEPLWVAKHTIERLREMEQANPYTFAGQYMQVPSPLEGGLFKVGNFEIVDALPATAKKSCRAWDLGATANDGDPTAGVKIYDGGDGYFYVADVEKEQWGVDEVKRNIKLNAEMDGKLTAIRLPQDPGQAGKAQAKDFSRLLAGYNVAILPVTGDKVTRAEPFASQVNMGNVRLLRGDWNKSFINEFALFPNGKHDDQVDAAADAFNHLFDMPNDEPIIVKPVPTITNFW